MFDHGKMQKKPKIAIIHPALGNSSGGSQVFVVELADRLKDKCDISILSAKKINDLCRPVFSLSRRNAALEQNFLYKAALDLMKKCTSSPDIVIEHLSSFFPVLSELLFGDYDVIFPNNDWGGLLAANAARKIKPVPILFTEHCGYMEKGKIASRNLKFKPDKYIVLSHEMEYWVKEHFKHIDVEYIPNGVNFEHFNPDIEPQNVNLPKPIFLTAGRNYGNKRLDLVIEAVARLNRGSLLILSSGGNIDALNQKGLDMLGEERFRLLSVPYDEIAHYYRACDVFTLPSDYEPFGLVYLEVMACNKPVVAPDDSSRREIIGDAGILCDVNNSEFYADALAKTSETDFGNIPFNQAQKYSWDITADKYYRVIDELIYAKN